MDERSQQAGSVQSCKTGVGVSGGTWGVRGRSEREDMSTHIADSLGYTAETNTTS